MATVSVNAPKTPVTRGSNGIASATVPNICKMPGPPAPFVPVPLPNIGRSGDKPKGYSRSVKIEGHPVAIRGASFHSVGDIASKGTGGGIVSANTHGPTKFISPGSLNVKIEGKNVHHLGDPMLNNCGAGGSPANAATLTGVGQMAGAVELPPFPSEINCDKHVASGRWDSCDILQLCEKVRVLNESIHTRWHDPADEYYSKTKKLYYNILDYAHDDPDERVQKWMEDQFYHPCARERWIKAGSPVPPNRKELGRNAFEADHVIDRQLGGELADTFNLKLLSASVNKSIGSSLRGYRPGEKHGKIELTRCRCP